MRRIALVVIVAMLALSGCVTMEPGMDTSARIRAYNGRNLGEVQGTQSMVLQFVLPEDPEAAEAAVKALGSPSQVMGNSGTQAQHFSGGGVQTEAGGKGGWLSNIFGRGSKPEPPSPPAPPE